MTARAKNGTGPAGDQTVSFTVTGANQKSKALTTNTNGEVTFCYKGENGGLDTITAFVDSNENKTKDESEPQDTATKHWLSNPSITLAPKTAENPLGSTHTLTATVTEAGAPVADVHVDFFSSFGIFNIACQESGSFQVTTDARRQGELHLQRQLRGHRNDHRLRRHQQQQQPGRRRAQRHGDQDMGRAPRTRDVSHAGAVRGHQRRQRPALPDGYRQARKRGTGRE